ncbi:PAS/PAC sensor hybrid histidine kinase [Halopseudomonas xinjiangensis]|uniref:histidine kinase n=1 Tax=Halopseudomonas xinjiangensis TaxID=487184 RepID=A0A1H1T2C7_9GAMM|nr:PAS domain-containing sensor histidine kinase [Halopseudomonas xinjiangensis]SDS54263.1 PAS/PAC sensor hybrid histidine kinase [Halopseudomonas xinjiangensis]
MNSEHLFLAGGGEMGGRMRERDWSTTPLGSPDTWPQSLRSAVSICLNSPVLGTVLWGPDLCMLYNDTYIPSMAERHPDALGRPVAEVWKETWDAVAPMFHHAMATGEGFAEERIELPMVRRGQLEMTYWNITASPIRGEDGSVVGLFNQGFEITSQIVAERERASAQQQLQQLNERLATEVTVRTEERDLMWDTAPDLMGIIDFDGILKRVNPAWGKLLGYSEEELVGHHVNEFVVSDDHSATVNAYEQAARGEQLQVTNRYRHKDGSVRWLSWTAAPAGNLTYATGRDITCEKEREAELAKAQAQLRQSQKMEAVGQLTGGLAHDFNNLLMAISASLDLIRLRIDQGRPRDTGKYIDAAQGASKRAASLTHRLLAFSRRQTLAPRPVDANELIEGMLDMIRRTVGPEISVECSGDAEPWIALVDASQLENALLNLCINSRDAMPNGGDIHIEIHNRYVTPEESRPHDLPVGEYLRLRVSDTGTGMPPDVIARAFDPFFTTKPIGMGTGLGLSMIYGFAKQSGGQVRLTSAVDQGTQVSIYLPRHQGVAKSKRTESSRSLLPIANADETVLVVDDDPTVRMLVIDVLEDLGYRVIQVANGLAGLEVLHSDVRIDLMITDVGLPGGMNGRQLADAGRVKRPHLPVLFITGYAEQALFNIANAETGMAVLTKPFAVSSLAARIRQLLRTE